MREGLREGLEGGGSTKLIYRPPVIKREKFNMQEHMSLSALMLTDVNQAHVVCIVSEYCLFGCLFDAFW